jgi:hypothetical protein
MRRLMLVLQGRVANVMLASKHPIRRIMCSFEIPDGSPRASLSKRTVWKSGQADADTHKDH